MILIRLMALLILAIAIALCHGGDSPWKQSTSSLRSGKIGSSGSSSSSSDDSSCTDEGEGCQTSFPDTYNGGCGGNGPYGFNSGFTNITFGESICGTISIYESEESFDFDFYYFKVSEDTTVSVRLTTDFDAYLALARLSDGASCPFTAFIADVFAPNVGDNTYVISSEVLQPGDYSIFVIPGDFDDSSLSCPTPGNYTLTLTDEPIP